MTDVPNVTWRGRRFQSEFAEKGRAKLLNTTALFTGIVGVGRVVSAEPTGNSRQKPLAVVTWHTGSNSVAIRDVGVAAAATFNRMPTAKKILDFAAWIDMMKYRSVLIWFQT